MSAGKVYPHTRRKASENSQLERKLISYHVISICSCHYRTTRFSIMWRFPKFSYSSNSNSINTVDITIKSTAILKTTTIASRENKNWTSPMSSLGKKFQSYGQSDGYFMHHICSGYIMLSKITRFPYPARQFCPAMQMFSPAMQMFSHNYSFL